MNPISRALGHLIRCRDATRLISRQQEAPVGGWQRWTLRMHLAVCDYCARFDRQMTLLREAMKRYRS